MNTARETGDTEFDLTEFENSNIFIMEDVLVEEMLEIFQESSDNLQFVLLLTLSTFLMPLNFFNKVVFSYLTRINFKLTLADYIDFIIVTIVTIIWIVVAEFETEDIKYPLFSRE